LVDELVALPDREIFDAMIWIMERCKLVVEGAAAAFKAFIRDYEACRRILR